MHVFTLHFATINTEELACIKKKLRRFTLHFATINTIYLLMPLALREYLHYTLLLLIPTKGLRSFGTVRLFTLHFATINTILFGIQSIDLSKFTLHFATINTGEIK